MVTHFYLSQGSWPGSEEVLGLEQGTCFAFFPSPTPAKHNTLQQKSDSGPLFNSYQNQHHVMSSSSR